MLELLIGAAIGAAGAFAYSNRATLVKDVDTAYSDAVTDLEHIEARLIGTSQKAQAASNAHAALASANASTAAKAANVAAAVSVAKTATVNADKA